jgi:cell division protein FtsB
MFARQQNKANQRIGFIILALIVLVFSSIGLVKEVINKHELKKNINELAGKIADLKKRNADLSETINYFQSMDFVEQEARTKLNLRKPGEKIIVVNGSLDNNSNGVVDGAVPLATSALNEGQEKTNPQKWWDYFFVDKF